MKKINLLTIMLLCTAMFVFAQSQTFSDIKVTKSAEIEDQTTKTLKVTTNSDLGDATAKTLNVNRDAPSTDDLMQIRAEGETKARIDHEGHFSAKEVTVMDATNTEAVATIDTKGQVNATAVKSVSSTDIPLIADATASNPNNLMEARKDGVTKAKIDKDGNFSAKGMSVMDATNTNTLASIDNAGKLTVTAVKSSSSSGVPAISEITGTNLGNIHEFKKNGSIVAVVDNAGNISANTAWFKTLGVKDNSGITAFMVNSNGYVVQKVGSPVASASTITPTGPIFHVTGTTSINTINIPFGGFTGTITIISDNAIAFGNNPGNLGRSFTTASGRTVTLTYDGSKWYPSN
jgi:hypothetical protein